MSSFTVTVELIRPLARGGAMYEPGAQIRVPVEEAASLFATGFARPLGARADWNASPRAAWVKSWQN